MRSLISSVAAVILIALSFGNASAKANGELGERSIQEIHSMMVYNFIKYIEWPAGSSNGEFVIGIIGDDEVFNTMKTWYGGKAVPGGQIIVKNYKNVDEIGNCQVLYVAANKSKAFSAIKDKIDGKSTLLVTNRDGLGAKGSCINFKLVNNKLKFELNKQAVAASKLKVSGRLAEMAIII
ncbi:MAG: YfiR family protein [Bacteroidota bacterium]